MWIVAGLALSIVLTASALALTRNPLALHGPWYARHWVASPN
jgi:hypothetical protein